MFLKNLKIETPVFLAPMAGITDYPTRKIVQSFGPNLVYTEMIASKTMHEKEFLKKIKKNFVKEKNNITSVQLAGSNIELMKEAAKIVEGEGGQIIDVNMGCPSKNVIGQKAGASLMKDPKLAIKILESIISTVSIPVTLKIRLGWDILSPNALQLALLSEKIGISLISIHARFRNQFFKGEPKWSLIEPISKSVKIPIIVNGDIVDANSAKKALDKSFASGIMIGRASLGNPWLVSLLSSHLYGKKKIDVPEGEDLIRLIKKHIVYMVSFYGKEKGINKSKKHLSMYLRKINLPNFLIKKALLSKDYKEVIYFLDTIIKENYLKSLNI